jgi:FR47-like protein
MIIGMIRHFPCTGVFYGPMNTLVSWCLTYDYGALGMLHTMDGHRNKGLAQRVVLETLLQWQKCDFGCPPFAYIADDNESSKRLFSKLGFYRSHSCTWEGFARTGRVELSKASEEDILGILDIHEANHIDRISEAEAKVEGFVFIKYDYSMLLQMHKCSPAIVAKIQNEVIGYALVVQ